MTGSITVIALLQNYFSQYFPLRVLNRVVVKTQGEVLEQCSWSHTLTFVTSNLGEGGALF